MKKIIYSCLGVFALTSFFSLSSITATVMMVFAVIVVVNIVVIPEEYYSKKQDGYQEHLPVLVMKN